MGSSCFNLASSWAKAANKSSRVKNTALAASGSAASAAVVLGGTLLLMHDAAVQGRLLLLSLLECADFVVLAEFSCNQCASCKTVPFSMQVGRIVRKRSSSCTTQVSHLGLSHPGPKLSRGCEKMSQKLLIAGLSGAGVYLLSKLEVGILGNNSDLIRLLALWNVLS